MPHSIEVQSYSTAGGEIKDFTGVSAPYEKPLTPNLTIDSIELQPSEAVRVIKQKLL